MRKTKTPKYVVDLKRLSGDVITLTWRVKSSVNAPGYGTPSKPNLEKFVQKHNESLKSGGVNAHLGERSRVVAGGVRLNIPQGDYLARWEAPMFELI